MGDKYQVEWLISLSERIKCPILEIGSKRYGPPPKFFDYREICPKGKYIGVDCEKGVGVDLIIDMTSKPDEILQRLGNEKFNTIICMSVMEHVKDIYSFASNVKMLMNISASIFVSVPFIWGIHAYPDDYWRFTPSAIKFLFSEIVFDNELSIIHTSDGRKASLSKVGNDYAQWMAAKTDIFDSLRKSLLNTSVNSRNTPMVPVMFDMYGVKLV